MMRELLSQPWNYGKDCPTRSHSFTMTLRQPSGSPGLFTNPTWAVWICSFIELTNPKPPLATNWNEKEAKFKQKWLTLSKLMSVALHSRDHSAFPAVSLMNTFVIYDLRFVLSWHTYKPGIIQFPVAPNRYWARTTCNCEGLGLGPMDVPVHKFPHCPPGGHYDKNSRLRGNRCGFPTGGRC